MTRTARFTVNQKLSDLGLVSAPALSGADAIPVNQRPVHVRVTSQEEGMPHGQVFTVVGWTGFDQAVVRDERDDCLLVLEPDDIEQT